ncbi:MAG: NDP-sugar synthase [Candidatus Micrarchaeota archaeon]
MKAILLAGGYGTRMFPLTLRTPKPMLPIAGRPVLQHTIELLVLAGISDIVISLKPNQRKIEGYFGTGKGFGAKISYVYEPESGEEGKLGSVGAINYVFSRIVANDDFLVIGGDNYIYGLNIADFQRAHSAKAASATIALFDLDDPEQVRHFGVAKLDAFGRITSFQEKPAPGKALSTLASTAVYALDRAFVEKHLPSYVASKHAKGQKADKIGDLWEHFVADLHIAGHPFEGIWGDIGSFEGYLETNRKSMAARLSEGGKAVSIISPKASIAKSARIIAPVIIEKGCEVGEGSVIGPFAHILHDAVIGDNCKVTNSIVFERSEIGAGAIVEDSIIDGKCAIGTDARVGGFSVIGFNSNIGKGSEVFASKIYPGISIKAKSRIKGRMLNEVLPSSPEMADSCYWL